jgi:hypothetical protein
MSRLRVTAEWMFRDITSTWTYLKCFFGLRVKQQPVAAFYVVAADLTNLRTILRGSCNNSLYFNCPPPSLEEYIAERVYDDELPEVNVANVDMGQVVHHVHLLPEGPVAVAHPELIPDNAIEDALDEFLFNGPAADANVLDDAGFLNFNAFRPVYPPGAVVAV